MRHDKVGTTTVVRDAKRNGRHCIDTIGLIDRDYDRLKVEKGREREKERKCKVKKGRMDRKENREKKLRKFGPINRCYTANPVAWQVEI